MKLSDLSDAFTIFLKNPSKSIEIHHFQPRRLERSARRWLGPKISVSSGQVGQAVGHRPKKAGERLGTKKTFFFRESWCDKTRKDVANELFFGFWGHFWRAFEMQKGIKRRKRKNKNTKRGRKTGSSAPNLPRLWPHHFGSCDLPIEATQKNGNTEAQLTRGCVEKKNVKCQNDD